ncbi:capsid protein [Paenalkalicoccus suaedae]|uniref:Capsid protein n=1 Tax=Paenalkalicoccus suaedae TaxID=2592382 RepID=A0A859FGE1_9BACI|nr:capsid protein [Paenalkalicoccus suaedae]QKS71660.1 capsid protein [Paenalkalicoccus suaedae]QKS71714.1 capsid protein [Paenalkalicoccus suaedae]
MAFELNYKNQFKLDVTPDAEEPSFETLAAGISSVEPANNEELDQTAYFDGEGFSETDVIGAQLVLSVSGHRKVGDAAQDYIFSKYLEVGDARRTRFEWETPSGELFEGNVTIANIEGPGGEARAKGEFSFEIHFNGKPEYTPAPEPTP